MADVYETKKINELNEATEAADSDLMMVGNPSSGQTSKITKENLMKDVNEEISELNSALTYNAGDTLNVEGYRCGGFVTSSSSTVQFSIPIDKPLGSGVNITSSNINLLIRQNGNYTHGSSSSVNAVPSDISFTIRKSFISLVCTMSATTNAVNNDACGIQLGTGSTLTFG